MKKFLLGLLAFAGIANVSQAATGTADSPLTVDDILEAGIPASPEADTWVTGYIVGWIDSGNKWGTDNRYSVPATVATNLILAGSSSENDPEYCIAIQLPSGAVRNALNLVDHPENLGHQVTLCGSHEKYFGTNGIKSVTKYEWVGDAPVYVEPTYGPEITGTAQNPLSVSKFFEVATAGTSIPDTFVKGVIVGYVSGISFDTAIINNLDAEEISNSNILIAETAEPASLAECIPVQLPFGAIRDALNLATNHDNLGKTVTLCGVHTNYFGTTGLKEVKAYAFGDDTIELPEGAFYTGLVKDANDWTFDNIELTGDLSYVWSWKSDYNYLNASAYKGGPNAAEAYAISPVFDLTNMTSASADFDHAAKFQTNLTTDCKFVVREQGESSWTELVIPTWPEAGGWTFVNSGTIDLGAYVGKKIEVGFKYVSTAEASDTWEIKNFNLYASNSDSAVETVETDVVVYGAEGYIVAPEGAQVYNLNGVATGAEDLVPGLYIVVTGQKSYKVVVR